MNQPVIDRAEQVVRSQCMARAGFSWWPVQPIPVARVRLDDLSRIPGKAPTEAAALVIARGADVLGWASGPSSEAAEGANGRYRSSLSPARQLRYQAVQTGGWPDWPMIRVRTPDGTVVEPPKNGCGAQASKAVFGSVARDAFQLNYVSLMQELVDQRVVALRAIKTKMKAWSRCMRAASGRSFPSPGAVQGWLAFLPRAKMRRLQAKYLVPMVECGYTAGLATTLAAATWSAVQALPPVFYRDLVRVRSWDAEALPRARAILARAKADCGRRGERPPSCTYWRK